MQAFGRDGRCLAFIRVCIRWRGDGGQDVVRNVSEQISDTILLFRGFPGSLIVIVWW